MYTPMLRGAFLWPLAWFSFALFLLYSPRQPAKGGDDFVPDWSPDDDEPETPAKPSPVDFTQLAAGADNRSEVLDRVLTLLEQQKLRSQAMVARQEAERTRSNWQEEAFSLICGPEPLRLLDLLDEVTESNVLMMRDGNDLNLLHQCCRIGCIPVVEKLLTIHPALTDQMTSPHGRPAFWSPLMVLLDAKRIMWEDSYKELMGLILASSSLATLEARAANRSSALHMACSRGQWWSTKKILYAAYHKAGGDQAAFGLVTSMVNQPNGRGAGCVPVVALCQLFFQSPSGELLFSKPIKSG